MMLNTANAFTQINMELFANVSGFCQHWECQSERQPLAAQALRQKGDFWRRVPQ
jgi:hypothetical protein